MTEEPKKGQKKNPTLVAAKRSEERSFERTVVTLSTGYKARLLPVSAKLLDDIAHSVKEPPVPKQFIEAKGRDEYNPLDPAYQLEVKEANRLRGLRTTEALVMFGIQLVEPIPDQDEWMPKLRYLEKRGNLDLSAFDFSDPLDVEFVFKNYIAVSTQDLIFASMASGLTDEEVAEAIAGFQRQKVRDAAGTGGSPA